MSKSLKIKFLLSLLLPFITSAGFYIYTSMLEKEFSNYPFESALNIIDTAKDKERIKALAMVNLNGYMSLQNDTIKVNYSFIVLLLSVAFVNIIFLYSIYQYCQQKVSNKSSMDASVNRQ